MKAYNTINVRWRDGYGRVGDASNQHIVALERHPFGTDQRGDIRYHRRYDETTQLLYLAATRRVTVTIDERPRDFMHAVVIEGLGPAPWLAPEALFGAVYGPDVAGAVGRLAEQAAVLSVGDGLGLLQPVAVNVDLLRSFSSPEPERAPMEPLLDRDGADAPEPSFWNDTIPEFHPPHWRGSNLISIADIVSSQGQQAVRKRPDSAMSIHVALPLGAADHTVSFAGHRLGEDGRYALVQEIGAGAMGIVFLAEDARLRRRVVIKILSPTLTGNSRIRERFHTEATIQANLEHAHIVRALDSFEDRGSLAIVMEYAQGPDLDAALAEAGGRLTLEQAFRVLDPILDAIQFAHTMGVVHRDLKPGNILLDRKTGTEVPKVTDFGIAKILGQEGQERTREGAVIGTPSYMPPEQLRGSQDLDHRADVFALGAILYQLVTGHMPLGEGSEYEITFRALSGMRPQPVSDHVPGIPPSFETVVCMAMEPDPELRYQTVADLRQDLRDVMEGWPPRGALAAAAARRREGAAGDAPPAEAALHPSHSGSARTTDAAAPPQRRAVVLSPVVEEPGEAGRGGTPSADPRTTASSAGDDAGRRPSRDTASAPVRSFGVRALVGVVAMFAAFAIGGVLVHTVSNKKEEAPPAEDAESRPSAVPAPMAGLPDTPDAAGAPEPALPGPPQPAEGVTAPPPSSLANILTGRLTEMPKRADIADIVSRLTESGRRSLWSVTPDEAETALRELRVNALVQLDAPQDTSRLEIYYWGKLREYPQPHVDADFHEGRLFRLTVFYSSKDSSSSLRQLVSTLESGNIETWLDSNERTCRAFTVETETAIFHCWGGEEAGLVLGFANPTVHATLLAEIGRLEEAAGLVEKAKATRDARGIRQSIAAYNRALALVPTYETARAWRAYSKLLALDVGGARKDVEMVEQQTKTYEVRAYAKWIRGRIALVEGRPDLALRLYREAASIDPWNSEFGAYARELETRDYAAFRLRRTAAWIVDALESGQPLPEHTIVLALGYASSDDYRAAVNQASRDSDWVPSVRREVRRMRSVRAAAR